MSELKLENYLPTEIADATATDTIDGKLGCNPTVWKIASWAARKAVKATLEYQKSQSDKKMKRLEKLADKKSNRIQRLEAELRKLKISFYNVCLGISRAIPELESQLIYVDDSNKDAGVWPMGVKLELERLSIGEVPSFTVSAQGNENELAQKDAQIKGLVEALRTCESFSANSPNVDFEANPENDSPEDATAWTFGLIYKTSNQALSALPSSLLETYRLEREVLEAVEAWDSIGFLNCSDWRDKSEDALLALHKKFNALQAHKKAIEGK